MYALYKSTLLVPVKQFYAIDKRCTILGASVKKRAKLTEVLKPARPIVIATGTKEEMKRQLVENSNTMIELPDNRGYEITEYFINHHVTEGKVTEKEYCDNYKLITDSDIYEPEEVKALELLLEELQVYSRFSTVIAYERYGFFKKKPDFIIEYVDERQCLRINTKTLQLEKEQL